MSQEYLELDKPLRASKTKKVKAFAAKHGITQDAPDRSIGNYMRSD